MKAWAHAQPRWLIRVMVVGLPIGFLGAAIWVGSIQPRQPSNWAGLVALLGIGAFFSLVFLFVALCIIPMREGPWFYGYVSNSSTKAQRQRTEARTERKLARQREWEAKRVCKENGWGRATIFEYNQAYKGTWLETVERHRKYDARDDTVLQILENETERLRKELAAMGIES